MEKIDLILVGFVVGGLKDLGTNLSRFKVLITDAVSGKDGGAQKLSFIPRALSIDVHGSADVSQKDRTNLSVVGSKVEIKVVGEPDNFKLQIINTVAYSHGSMDSLLKELAKQS